MIISLFTLDFNMFITNVFTGFSVGLGTGICNYFIFKKLLGEREKKRQVN